MHPTLEILFRSLAPWLVLQPGLGLGIAASKTSAPALGALKSVISHSVYGAGLFFAARAANGLIAAATLWCAP